MRGIKPKIECLLVALVVLTLTAVMTSAATASRVVVKLDDVSPGSYKIVQDGVFNVIQMKNFAMTDSPGDPMLPHRVQDILLSPDVIDSTVKLNIVSAKTRLLEGTYNIQPAGLPVRGDSKNIVDGRNIAVYQSDADYPESVVKLLCCSQMRKWKFARIDFTPFQYNPVSGRLTVTESVEIEISYSTSPAALKASLMGDKVWQDIAAKRFINYAEVSSSYEQPMSSGQPLPSQPTHDYVIITTSAINNNSAKLNAFVAHKQSLGHSVLVVIRENSIDGLVGQAPNNRAEKIRQWLIDNYISEGIQYVLLIGDPSPYESGEGDIPMKMCHPEMNAYYEDVAQTPTDYFYADLTGNWDIDGDLFYGEWDPDGDGTNYFGDYPVTGGVDFTPEVYVGRIPVYDANYTSLDNILQKMMDYENESSKSWRASTLLPMGFQHSSGPYDGAQLAEQMIFDYLGPAGYSNWRMYQQGNGPCGNNSSYTSEEDLRGNPAAPNVKNRWSGAGAPAAPNDFGIVCWWAHGSTTSASVGYSGCWDGTLFQSSYCPSLDNNHPAFTYQCSCSNGYPENSNNLQYAILKQGGIGTVSATRVSWFSTSIGYGQFNGSVTNSGIGYEYVDRLVQNLGAGDSLYLAKSSMSPNAHQCWLMNWYDFNLYGDPAQSIGVVPSQVVKWEQLPDETGNGIDIRCDRADGIPRTLADDFLCTTAGPINKVVFWGSWRGDIKGQIQTIHLSIHSNDPCGPYGYSEPDELLWSKDFSAADFVETLYMYYEPEWFWDPTTGAEPNGYEHFGIWQYDVSIDTNDAFIQQGDPCNPVVYWLDIWVQLAPDPCNPEFGWKTSDEHWEDDAVYWDDYLLMWNELRYPPEHLLFPDSIDLAFRIITGEEPNQPTIKYVQNPDLSETGIDVDTTRDIMAMVPWDDQLLADDFPCTRSGPITDIHIWGSWYYDELPYGGPNDVEFITLSIHADLPVGDPCNPYDYSIPGEILWTHDFMPGDFEVVMEANGLMEGYYVPCEDYYAPYSDWTCWRYDFSIDPCDAFIQRGDPCEPVIYWLDVQVAMDGMIDTERFGWKTSLEHWNDDAVWARGTEWDHEPWQELRYPQGHPFEGDSIDLAFAITTAQEEPHIPEPKLLMPHTKWSQPPIEIDPNSPIPTYCGWDEPSFKQKIAAMFPCWDNPRQCHGDADGVREGNVITGYYWVGSLDLAILTAAMGGVYPNPPYNHCADFDRNFVVDTADSNILNTWYLVKEPPKGPGVPPDCPLEGGGEIWHLVADDFRCIGSMPVTSIHWWGSFLGWELPGQLPPVLPEKWWIGFWSNMPAGELPYSYPDMLLHSITIPADRVDFEEVGSDEYYGFPYDICYQYNVELEPNEVFWQDDFNEMTYDDIYWISIAAEYNDVCEPYYLWGWKTRPWSWMDDAVIFDLPFEPEEGSVTDPCTVLPIVDPCGESVDVAFELDTDPNYIKWEQIYNGKQDWWLMGWWKFDEGSGSVANDSSGNNRNGVLHGNPTWKTSGSPVGNSGYLEFDGLDDYVDVNCFSQGAPLLLPVYTVSTWFRVDGDSSNPADPNRDFVSITDAAVNHGFLFEIRGNNVLRYVHRHPFVYAMLPNENIFTTTTYNDGLWHHAAAVRASDNSRVLYVDGQPVGSDSNATTAFDAPMTIILGALFSQGYTQGGRWWNGAIDDVRIYNRALSATEVVALYNGDEIGHWPHYEDEKSMYDDRYSEDTRVVADDWRCLRRTPVTAIVWWGSYIGYGYEACSYNDPCMLPVPPDSFVLSVWTDVPAGSDPCYPFSHPNEPIWDYFADDYDEVLVGYDKHPLGEPNEPVFRYSVRIPEEQWFRQPDYDGVFWLSVMAVYDYNVPNYEWGWTNHQHVFNDNAVANYYDDVNEVVVWAELYDQTGKSEDMSFILFTDPNECVNCADYSTDFIVNFEDYADFADDWRWVGPSGGYNNSDLDCNGIVDFKDLGIFCMQWLNSCP